jgi:hypothetical protein
MPPLRPGPFDFLGIAGFALLTAGAVCLWGPWALLLSGAVLLGFAVFGSIRLANLKPSQEQSPDVTE